MSSKPWPQLLKASTFSSPVLLHWIAWSMMYLMQCAVSGAGMTPSVCAKALAAWNTSFWWNATEGTWPLLMRELRDGAFPWYLRPPEWMGGDWYLWPTEDIFRSGVISAASPKSYV